MTLLRFSARPATSIQALVSGGRWEEVANMVKDGLSPSVMATNSFSVLEEFFRQAAKGLLPEDMDQDGVFETLILSCPLMTLIG